MEITTRYDCEIFEHLEFETGSAIGARARIGLVVLATDYTIEHEFRRIINVPGVDIYQARIRNEPTITPETLAAMGPLLTDTAALILPGAELDVVAFGCTSASMVMGEEFVDSRLPDPVALELGARVVGEVHVAPAVAGGHGTAHPARLGAGLAGGDLETGPRGGGVFGAVSFRLRGHRSGDGARIREPQQRTSRHRKNRSPNTPTRTRHPTNRAQPH